MHATWLRHGLRTLIACLGAGALVLSPATSLGGRAETQIQRLSDTAFIDGAGFLNLVAEVQNTAQDTNADQQDLTLMQVNFNLYDGANRLIGTEMSTLDNQVDRLGPGERSPVAAKGLPPGHFDHYTVTAPVAVAAPTPPDHEFTITPGACPAGAGSNDACGTVVNDNPVTVKDVRVIATFYTDSTRKQVVDTDSQYIATDIESSLAPGLPGARYDLSTDQPYGDVAVMAESNMTRPGVPSGVTAVPGNASATVSWTAPSDNGGLLLTGYSVTASPPDVAPVSVGAASTSTAVTGLHNGTAYTFTVSALNALGKSHLSAPSSAVTPATVPSAPTEVTATPGNASAVVHWVAPFNGGSPITRYTVTSSPGGNSVNVGGISLQGTVTGLTNGTAYTFKVSATNAIGTGLVSAASNAIVPATVPGAPTNVQAVAGDKSATVSWAAPSSNGGLSISGYTATSTPGGFSASVGGTVRQATVSGLTNGTSYTFKVTATNAVGTSSPSAPSNAVTPAASALTLDPTIVPAFPPQTVGTVSASKQVTLTNNSGARVVASITTSQDYQQSNTCGDGIVANGGSCTVSVQFKPTQTGSRPGTLTVTYAGAGSPQKALLSGTGIGWNPWDRPGGQLASSPVAVSSATGIADGFARGTDGALWHWSNGKWESLGGHPASDPSVVSAGDGQFDVFVRFTDGGLWHSKFNGRWQPWQPLGGQLSGEPAAVLDAAGNLDVFVRGTDSHLYRASFRNGSWTWTGYGGVLGAPPAATSPVAGEVDAIVVGADHQLYRWSSAATLSGGWSAVGGRAFGKPGVTSSRPGQIDAFVEGTDLQLWHWVSSGSQSSWELVGGRLASSPAAVSWGAGRLDAFVQGTDHVLWHAFKGGSSWQWEGLGKQMVGTPGAVVVAGTRFDVFIQGSDNALYHRSFETT